VRAGDLQVRLVAADARDFDVEGARVAVGQHHVARKGRPLLRLDVARREFEEETGHPAPDGDALELGEIRQKGGKVVIAWALEGDLDPSLAVSNTFEMEWPPRGGRTASFPEIDRVEWFDLDTARIKVEAAQIPLLERLAGAVGR